MNTLYYTTYKNNKNRRLPVRIPYRELFLLYAHPTAVPAGPGRGGLGLERRHGRPGAVRRSVHRQGGARQGQGSNPVAVGVQI